MADNPAKAAFLNRVRSLFNIDGYRLPELSERDQREFMRDPVRFSMRADMGQFDAIWREIEARQIPTPQPPSLIDAAKAALAFIDGEHCEWIDPTNPPAPGTMHAEAQRISAELAAAITAAQGR